MKHLPKLLLFSLLGTFSCKLSQKIPNGQKVYLGPSFNIVKNDSTKSEDLIELNEYLATVTRPSPNTVSPLTAFPYKVNFYYILKQGKHKKGLGKWLDEKLSEKPVFFNDFLLKKNEKILNEWRS